MADEKTTRIDRIRTLINANLPGAAADVAPSITAEPMPGFRFGLGARVIDLHTGDRGFVRAAYYGAAIGGPVYEVSIAGRGVVPRRENELEPERPLMPAPAIAPKP